MNLTLISQIKADTYLSCCVCNQTFWDTLYIFPHRMVASIISGHQGSVKGRLSPLYYVATSMLTWRNVVLLVWIRMV